MPKVTQRSICAAIAKKHGLEPDMVELHRDQGTWYWVGKVGAVFESSMVGYLNLGDWTLERWVEDFDSHVEEWQSNPFNEGKTLREYIDGIKWSLNGNE